MTTLDDAKDALAAPAGAPTPTTEALIEAMYIAAHADEDFSAEEREHFTANVVGISGGRLRAEDVKGVILKLAGKAKQGRDVRLKSIAGRLPRAEDREHAFALACTMTQADAVVRDEERAFFDELATALGISSERAASVLEELKSLEPEEE